MTSKTRNPQMDILKGIGIVLIVLGHSGFPGTHFLYLFHLAIFFIVSGYFFKEDYVKDKQSLKKFIINKIKRLYLPFVIANVICILLNNFFIDIKFYNNVIHHYFSLKDIAISVIKVMLFKGHVEMTGATWFFQILFLITIFYAIIEYIIKKYSNKTKNIIQLIVSILFFAIGYYLSIKNISIKIMGLQVLTCYILFDFGRKISKYKIETKESTKSLIMISSFILLVILNKIGTIEMSQHKYTNPIYFLTVSILGWYFVYELSYFMSKLKVTSNMLQYIGKNTMSILICHFIAFKIVNLIGVMIFNENVDLISKFPFAFRGSYWWLIYAFAGIIIPLAFNKIKNILKGYIITKG